MTSTECPGCLALQAEVSELRAAVASRDVIGQAKGLVMAATGCDPDEAFAVLVAQSQYENRKVRAVAAEMIARPRTAAQAAVYAPIVHQPTPIPFGPTLVATISTQGSTARVALEGEADVASVVGARACLEGLLATHAAVVVDLDGVDFADSRFVATIDALGREGSLERLTVRNVPIAVERIATVLGIGRFPGVDSGVPG